MYYMNDGTLQKRCAGVLLHITSLPNRDLGADAYRFVDFLAQSGMSLWQILPLGPTQGNLSPYQCLSAHAGNPKLISLQNLANEPWFNFKQSTSSRNRRKILKLAYQVANQDKKIQQNFLSFCNEHAFWLEDYAIFSTLLEIHGNKPWFKWPKRLRNRDIKYLKEIKLEFTDRINQFCFEQFIFFQQWLKLKAYANQNGIFIIGDMPIFIAHNCVDVWAHPEYFTLDQDGQLTSVAGVPPDSFSKMGQRWGNPLYCWDKMEADGFQWWIQRMGTQFKLYDIVRVDHFRGFESYWEIPAAYRTAMKGHWVTAPGEALFTALKSYYGTLPIIAEDLGYITPEVETLRDQFYLPGMRILQFAFDGNPNNSYLPANHIENCAVYTGTHDNDTTLGWFNSLSKKKQQTIYKYLGDSKKSMPWDLIQSGLNSIAQYIVIPMQDILELGSEGRMNVPGTIRGNWRWYFNWQQIKSGLQEKLYGLLANSNRL